MNRFKQHDPPAFTNGAYIIKVQLVQPIQKARKTTKSQKALASMANEGFLSNMKNIIAEKYITI